MRLRISVMLILTSVSLCPFPATAQSLSDFLGVIVRDMDRHAEPQTPKARKSNIRWLVISSRSTLDESTEIAQSFVATIGPTMVVETSNGFGIIAGFLDVAKAKANLESLVALNLIPKDSFLTTGQTFGDVIWNSDPNAEPVQVVHHDALRATVSRMQSAFKRLQLYDGEIDGAVGPATTAAYQRFQREFEATSFGVINNDTLTSIEAAARDGFRNDPERAKALADGFSDASSYQEALNAGFQSFSEWSQAKSLGFKSAVEFRAYLQSGFETKTAFDRAKLIGIGTKTEFDKHLTKAASDARQSAENLIDEASIFIRLNPTSGDVVEVAKLLSEVKKAAGGSDLTLITNTTVRLSDYMGQLPGFISFSLARKSEREAIEQQRIAEVVGKLSARQENVLAWMRANLNHSAISDLANEIEKVKAALGKRDIAELEAAAQSLEVRLKSTGTAALVDQLSDNQSISHDEAKADTFIARTPDNSFLIDGSLDELVLLYNASPSAPNLIRNIAQDLVFENKTAAICLYPAEVTPSFRRSLASELQKVGVQKIDGQDGNCNISNLMNQDVILFERGAFLKAEPSLVVQILDNLRSRQLRRFDLITSEALRKNESLEQAAIATVQTDVEGAGRNGFGALWLPRGGNTICAVLPENEGSHNASIAKLKAFIATERSETTSVEMMNSDQAFRALQKEECSVMYASQPDLKAVSAALHADGREFSFLPLWFSNEEIASSNAAVAERRRQTVLEEEQRRADAAQERRLAEEARRVSELQADKQEEALRRQYGAQARSGQAVLDSVASALLDFPRNDKPDQLAAGRSFFPAFANWVDTMRAERWSIDGYSSEIAEYGIATWKTRLIPSIAIRASIKLVNADRGERKEVCFMLGILTDTEFGKLRDPIEIECSNSEVALSTWSVGHQLDSQWRVARTRPLAECLTNTSCGHERAERLRHCRESIAKVLCGGRVTYASHVVSPQALGPRLHCHK